MKLINDRIKCEQFEKQRQMQNYKPEFNAKIGMALAVLVVVASVAWPLLTAEEPNPTSNERLPLSSSNASVDEQIVFESTESALSAFSILCLGSEPDFSSIKKDLADIGANISEFQREGERHAIYTHTKVGGSVIFTTGDNYYSCGMAAHGDYLKAEAVTIDWFFKQRKAPNYPMFGDQSDRRISMATYDAHVWKLEKPDSDKVELVQIKELPNSLVSVSRTIIDFTR